MNSFEADFMATVPRWAERYVIKMIRGPFLDFWWDRDTRLEEMLDGEGAMQVDSVVNHRRVMVERIRGEIRYWLASHRDPMLLNEGELGTVASLSDLARLCDEFLVEGLAFDELSTLRMTNKGRKGRTD